MFVLNLTSLHPFLSPCLSICSENIITLLSLKWVISYVEDATTNVLWLLNGTEQWSMEPLGERAGTNFNPGMDRWQHTDTHTRTHTHSLTHRSKDEGGRNKQQHVGHFLVSLWALTKTQTDRHFSINKECFHLLPKRYAGWVRDTHAVKHVLFCVCRSVITEVFLSSNESRSYGTHTLPLQSVFTLLCHSSVIKSQRRAECWKWRADSSRLSRTPGGQHDKWRWAIRLSFSCSALVLSAGRCGDETTSICADG